MSTTAAVLVAIYWTSYVWLLVGMFVWHRTIKSKFKRWTEGFESAQDIWKPAMLRAGGQGVNEITLGFMVDVILAKLETKYDLVEKEAKVNELD